MLAGVFSMPEPCRNNLENPDVFLKNNPVQGIERMIGPYLLCRNGPEPCRNAGRDFCSAKYLLPFYKIGENYRVLDFVIAAIRLPWGNDGNPDE